MTGDLTKTFARVFKKLSTDGLLLVSGAEIQDVRRLVSNRDVKGSWWKDPAAHTIFAINEMLEDHPDVTVTKLIARKVTFVHRSIWDPLFAVATAREEWQVRKLSPEALKLLKRVDKQNSVETDKLSSTYGAKPGETAKELELRLLVHSSQVHTESGMHAKVLQSWRHWTSTVSFRPNAMDVKSARTFFEQRLEEINPETSGCGYLPWTKKRR